MRLQFHAVAPALPDVLPIAEAGVPGYEMSPWIATPEEFGARMKTDHDKYGRLIKMTGARID